MGELEFGLVFLLIVALVLACEVYSLNDDIRTQAARISNLDIKVNKLEKLLQTNNDQE